MLLHLGEQLPRRYDLIESPPIAITNIHKLDESNDVPGPAKVFEQIKYRVIIHTALHNDIDLHGR